MPSLACGSRRFYCVRIRAIARSGARSDRTRGSSSPWLPGRCWARVWCRVGVRVGERGAGCVYRYFGWAALINRHRIGQLEHAACGMMRRTSFARARGRDNTCLLAPRVCAQPGAHVAGMGQAQRSATHGLLAPKTVPGCEVPGWEGACGVRPICVPAVAGNGCNAMRALRVGVLICRHRPGT